ncbi:MAG: hypothetical protein ACFE8L_01180 [Candidatus Hodarchaeota archaeon]
MLDISYIISFNLSTELVFSENFALFLWNLSIILMIFKLSMMSTIHSYILLKKRTRIFMGFLYCLLGGIIISLLYLEKVFDIKESEYYSNYIFQNISFFVCLIIFIILISILTIYIELRGYPNISDKKLAQFFNRLSVFFCINNVFYAIYLVFQHLLLRILFLSVYIIFSSYLLFTIIKKPDLFVVITNKIFDFIIFHRSGILLYSFDFETDKETEESVLKGSILIGISHILNNIIDKKDKLSVVKMKEKDIILEYDSNFGYALLLVAKHKNYVIEKSVQQFMLKFNEIFKEPLMKIKDLSQLVDISVFTDTKLIINEIFAPYIIKN